MAGTTAAVATEQPIVLRLSYSATPGDPIDQFATLFRREVQRRFGYQIDVKLFPENTLYGEETELEALRRGDVEMIVRATSKLDSLSESLRIFDLPFLWNDPGDVDCFLATASGATVLAALNNFGVKPTIVLFSGARVISANKPILGPEDMRGLRIRTENAEVFRVFFKSMGASVVKLEPRMVASAIARKLVDSQDSTWEDLQKYNIHLAQRYITETRHTALIEMVMVNQAFWTKLPPNVRSSLEEILKGLKPKAEEIMAATNAEAQAQVNAAQSSYVIELTPEDWENWRTLARGFWPKFATEVGEQALVDADKCSSHQKKKLPK